MKESNSRLRVWNPLGNHSLCPLAPLAGIEPARTGSKPDALSAELQRRSGRPGTRTQKDAGFEPAAYTDSASQPSVRSVRVELTCPRALGPEPSASTIPPRPLVVLQESGG